MKVLVRVPLVKPAREASRDISLNDQVSIVFWMGIYVYASMASRHNNWYWHYRDVRKLTQY